MTDDVQFAKSRFATALVGFGSGFGRGPRSRDNDVEREGQVNNASVDEIIPDAPSMPKKPALSNIEIRRKAERAASNAGRRGSRPKKLATIGMRCTAKQKMILLALMEHLGSSKQSDVAVEAILMVAAECEIKGAADELAAIQAERADTTATGDA
jgi:hypothetical protein